MRQTDLRERLRKLVDQYPTESYPESPDPDCPPPHTGYVFAFKFVTTEGDCWCVYHRQGDPEDVYMQPCI